MAIQLTRVTTLDKNEAWSTEEANLGGRIPKWYDELDQLKLQVGNTIFNTLIKIKKKKQQAPLKIQTYHIR